MMGETWIRHYGIHTKESTRGLIAPGMEDHPILKGVIDIWVHPTCTASPRFPETVSRWCWVRCCRG